MIYIPGFPGNGACGLALDEPELSPTQQKAAVFIALAGKPVTLGEIAREFSWHRDSVTNLLRELRRKGLVWSEGFQDRMIRLARPLRWRELPVDWRNA